MREANLSDLLNFQGQAHARTSEQIFPDFFLTQMSDDGDGGSSSGEDTRRKARARASAV